MLRPDDFDQFHLIELMHSNHAPRANTRRPRLGPEARAVRAIRNGQLAFLQNLIPMNVCYRSLRRRQEKQFAESSTVQTFLDRISLVFELGKLSHADHAIPAD